MNSSLTCKNCGAPLAGAGEEHRYCPACILRQSLLIPDAGSMPTILAEIAEWVAIIRGLGALVIERRAAPPNEI